jgi:hypothetical protein
MIGFTEWLQNEVRYKGFYRKFRQEHPEMPHAAAKDVYNSRFAGPLSNIIRRHEDGLRGNASTQPLPARELLRRQRGQPESPTAAPETAEFATRETPWARVYPPGPEAFDPDQPSTVAFSPDLASRGVRRTPDSDLPSNTPSRITQAQGLRDYHWEELVINVDPSDFVGESLNNWISRHFGYKEYGVRDDLERTDRQRGRYSTPEGAPVADGNNEPVIIVREGNKFRLIEGFHRTMWLLLAGAPEEQRQALMDLRTDPREYLDFDPWREVPIKAFVGTKPSKANAAVRVA